MSLEKQDNFRAGRSTERINRHGLKLLHTSQSPGRLDGRQTAGFHPEFLTQWLSGGV